MTDIQNLKITEEEIYLNDTWNIYFHDPFEKDWTTKSYILISPLSSINDFWININCLIYKGSLEKYNTDEFKIQDIEEYLTRGMFFIMREHIFPCWDDAENINGGRLSIKILKEKTLSFWINICSKLLGETLLKKEYKKHWNIVNGISISPKKQFCIVKIWIKDDVISDKNCFDLENEYYGDIIYESNIESVNNYKL